MSLILIIFTIYTICHGKKGPTDGTKYKFSFSLGMTTTGKINVKLLCRVALMSLWFIWCGIEFHSIEAYGRAYCLNHYIACPNVRSIKHKSECQKNSKETKDILKTKEIIKTTQIDWTDSVVVIGHFVSTAITIRMQKMAHLLMNWFSE